MSRGDSRAGVLGALVSSAPGRSAGAAATAAAVGAGLRRDAGSPLWLPPREGRCCRGSCAARGEGRRGGGRVRPHCRPPSPEPGVRALAPRRKAPERERRAQRRLLRASQAGRAPGREGGCEPGLGEGTQGARQERVSREGKDPGRRCALRGFRPSRW